ncbi:hypothetical protein JOB18_028628 [Solea senegalensis]|uniref:Uncharacterized protein n=1 Tax=Solea senegalensis TaxID=28829 RepID=A0AAV6S4W9_SOLSE|nr:hypothetical protein JOB18_028628 [Solea senegalensis]
MFRCNSNFLDTPADQEREFRGQVPIELYQTSPQDPAQKHLHPDVNPWWTIAARSRGPTKKPHGIVSHRVDARRQDRDPDRSTGSHSEG